ncbi:hypothetical protein HUT15_36910 (plasmid) [Streptomyces sp. NA03103]|uniref:hypothetical protein n=1 Tax=Streptomyces TaxID=1883 RepID=UPI00159274EB|nr:hypothetical protein [Streptomyces sp. NA03103]QKW66103.1 hypothetical protein HUT15_36910 [Streptomyces sp. NA03103]
MVRYVFRPTPGYYGDHKGPAAPCDGSGDGQGVYYNAASGYNQNPYGAYSVYSSTGYGGQNKWFPKYDGIARNLPSGIKNHNGSHQRY